MHPRVEYVWGSEQSQRKHPYSVTHATSAGVDVRETALVSEELVGDGGEVCKVLRVEHDE